MRRVSPIAEAIFKLILVLLVFIIVDVILLMIWTFVDPYEPKFLLVDNADLVGAWYCTSNNLRLWLTLQLVLLSGMIVFGIMVIYQTWTWSNENVVLETRWVLIALYNIVLVMVSLSPFLSSTALSDESVAIVMGIGIDFSALGIIFAVLLPRVIKNIQGSTSAKDSGAANNPISSTHGQKEHTHTLEISPPHNLGKYSTTEKPGPGYESPTDSPALVPQKSTLHQSISDESLRGIEMQRLCPNPSISASSINNQTEFRLAPSSPSITPLNSGGFVPILENSGSEGEKEYSFEKKEYESEKKEYDFEKKEYDFESRGMSRLEGPENTDPLEPTLDPLVSNPDESAHSPIFNPFTAL